MINLCQTDVPGPLQGGQTGQSVKLPNFDFSVVTTIREGSRNLPLGAFRPPPKGTPGVSGQTGSASPGQKRGGWATPQGGGGEVAIWGVPSEPPELPPFISESAI